MPYSSLFQIHDDYVTKMTVAMKGLVVGDGMNPKTNIGPLINDGAVKKVVNLTGYLFVCLRMFLKSRLIDR